MAPLDEAPAATMTPPAQNPASLSTVAPLLPGAPAGVSSGSGEFLGDLLTARLFLLGFLLLGLIVLGELLGSFFR